MNCYWVKRPVTRPAVTFSEAKINQSPLVFPHHQQNPCPDMHEIMLVEEGGEREGGGGEQSGEQSDTRLDSVSMVESRSIKLPVPVPQ